MQEGYCVKCKSKVEILNGQESVLKNGRNALSGNCKNCGTKIFKILPNKK